MSGPRDHEPIYGFESYRRLARRLMAKYYTWIPKEERDSVAALAAAEVLAVHGEETILKEAMPIVQQVLREQEYAWGMRQGKRDDGNYGARKYEWPLAVFELESGDYHDDVNAGGIVGVGNWSQRVRNELYTREPDAPGTPSQRMQLYHQIMDALIKSSPKLQKIKEQWEHCPHRNMAELCAGGEPTLPGTVKELSRARSKARTMLAHYEQTGEVNPDLANPAHQKPGPKPGSTWTQKQKEPEKQHPVAALPEPAPARNWQGLLDAQQEKTLSKKYEITG